SRPPQATRSPNEAPSSMLRACEHKPEILAANATRAFLGVNLECAQCHNHPFARWTRDQFWQTAAFFSKPKAGSKVPALRVSYKAGPVFPAFITGDELAWPEQVNEDTGRAVLVRWMTSTQNRYFARNAVNLLWGHYLGATLIQALDQPGEDDA